MKHSILAASVILAVVVPTSVSSASMAAPSARRIPCTKTFTVKMAKRAIDVTYSGTRRVVARELRNIRRYVRCQRYLKHRHVLNKYWRHAASRWRTRNAPALTGPVIASWYDDSGGTGCGFHTTYGIATFVVPCGGHVLLKFGGHTVVATRDDSGPYVGGRVFDLNPTTKTALGCSDLCPVYYSVQ